MRTSNIQSSLKARIRNKRYKILNLSFLQIRKYEQAGVLILLVKGIVLPTKVQYHEVTHGWEKMPVWNSINRAPATVGFKELLMYITVQYKFC